MNRRTFLRRGSLASAGLIVGDAALEAFDRLTWTRRLFPGFTPAVIDVVEFAVHFTDMHGKGGGLRLPSMPMLPPGPTKAHVRLVDVAGRTHLLESSEICFTNRYYSGPWSGRLTLPAEGMREVEFRYQPPYQGSSVGYDAGRGVNPLNPAWTVTPIGPGARVQMDRDGGGIVNYMNFDGGHPPEPHLISTGEDRQPDFSGYSSSPALTWRTMTGHGA